LPSRFPENNKVDYVVKVDDKALNCLFFGISSAGIGIGNNDLLPAFVLISNST
jgi:hypothetical protein